MFELDLININYFITVTVKKKKSSHSFICRDTILSIYLVDWSTISSLVALSSSLIHHIINQPSPSSASSLSSWLFMPRLHHHNHHILRTITLMITLLRACFIESYAYDVHLYKRGFFLSRSTRSGGHGGACIAGGGALRLHMFTVSHNSRWYGYQERSPSSSSSSTQLLLYGGDTR